MSSPFRIFRKNAKGMMAFLFVVLMLTWVIGDSLFNWFAKNQNASAADSRKATATVVSWDGGSLTNQQVMELQRLQKLANQFQQTVHMKGQQSAAEAGLMASPLRVQPVETPTSEQGVVQYHILAEAARNAGMVVSDEMLQQYLRELGRNKVSPEAMRQIIKDITNRQVSPDDVLNTVRDDILAHNFLVNNQYLFATSTPEQRWRDWCAVNERVVVEAAAVPVQSFVIDVKDPTEAELQTFFDKYKDIEPGPDQTGLPSATPGFRIPRKIDVAYITADFNEFVTKIESQITDDEIAKYYEANKERLFLKADTNLFDDKGDKDKDKDKKDADKSPKSDDKPATPEAKPDASQLKANDTTAPATDAKPSTPATTPSANETKSGATTTKSPSTNKSPSSSKKGSTPAKKDSNTKKSSLNETKSPFRLVAFDETTAAADAAKADPSAAAAPPATATSGKAAEITALPGAPALGQPANDAPKKPLQFLPLEQVKDVIRNRIARDRAGDELKKLAGDILGQLDASYNKFANELYTAQGEKKTPPAPPEKLTNLQPLAEANGLKSATTGPMTIRQMYEMPLGKSSLPDSRQPLLQVLFGAHQLELFQPVESFDLDGNHYVALKTSDAPARTPQLSEVRDEVVKAWKLTKAAELAEKHAQDLVKKANEAKTPLTEFFADDKAIKVVRTDPFSMLTGGDVGLVNPQQYRLSQPNGIEAGGPDFLKKVFKLKDGEVGSVLNNDHTIAYVIRVVEHQPSMNELHTTYLTEANNWPGIQQMREMNAQSARDLTMYEFFSGLKVNWARSPDQRQTASVEDEGG